MIFNVNNTKVEVLIPDIVPKLKPELADQLYANHEPNEIYEILRDYKRKDHYEKSVNTVGIWMSGGADSSLLAYVLAKKIKDENLDIKIQPLSVRRGRPNNPIYAGNINYITTGKNVTNTEIITYKIKYTDVNGVEHEYSEYNNMIGITVLNSYSDPYVLKKHVTLNVNEQNSFSIDL